MAEPTPPSPVPGNPPPARTALVTGASRGIGRHLALGLAEAGLDLALIARDEERLGEVAALARARGATVTVHTGDVTDLDAVRAAVDGAVHELGDIDLLVNNAGSVDTEVPLWEADAAQWWHVVETNVRGPFHLSHTVVPAMLARGGGRVVDLSSGLGVRDSAIYSAYNVAKTALLRMGGALHEAGYGAGLRTFEMAPGVVRTDMTAAMPMHTRRTEWTDPADVVALLVSIARGDLDDWSGCYLRAGPDTPESLRAAAAAGDGPQSRRLGVPGLSS